MFERVCLFVELVADIDAMTSKNSSVSASTTMSSLGKACLELSKSIKGFRFSRQSPQDSKDAVSSSGQTQQSVAAGGQTTLTTNTRLMTTEDGAAPLADDASCGVSDGATGGGSSVTSTISRVIRSATNRVRAFPSSPAPSPHHQHHQQLPACNAVNGHSPPAHVPLPPPSLPTPPLPATSARTTRARYFPPAGNTDVWHDEQFLLQFFRYFSTMELRVLAQVLVTHSFTLSFSSLCDFNLFL